MRQSKCTKQGMKVKKMKKRTREKKDLENVRLAVDTTTNSLTYKSPKFIVLTRKHSFKAVTFSPPAAFKSKHLLIT